MSTKRITAKPATKPDPLADSILVTRSGDEPEQPTRARSSDIPGLIQVERCGARLPFDPTKARRSNEVTIRLAIDRLRVIYRANGPVGRAADRAEAAEMRFMIARHWSN